jgi:hypothetical protein
MPYRSKAVSLSDAAWLVAESLGRESGRDPREPIREARYELIQALRDGEIEAEGEHIIATSDLLRRIEIRKVSRVWWAEAVVEPPYRVDLWKPGRVYLSWSGGGALVIGPWCSPPPAGHVIDGAILVRQIRLEEESLLAIWPIVEPSQGRTDHSAITSTDVGEVGKLRPKDEIAINSADGHAPATAEDPAGTRDSQANGKASAAPRRQHGPSPTADKIKEAGQALIDEGHMPPETVPWKQFQKMLCQKLRIQPGARGYSLDSIQNALRPLLQKRQAAKLSYEDTEDTENTES